MLLFAIDTVSPENLIALAEYSEHRKNRGGRELPKLPAIIAKEGWTGNQNQSKKIFPTMQRIFKKSKKKWEDIDAILVVCGPGSFTSLRVGVSVANAIAYSLKIPMYEIKKTKSRNLESMIETFDPKTEKSVSQSTPLYDKAPNISQPKRPLTAAFKNKFVDTRGPLRPT